MFNFVVGKGVALGNAPKLKGEEMSIFSNKKADLQRECAKQIAKLDDWHRRQLMSNICFDRIELKQEFLTEKYHTTESWNETLYFMLLRSLDIKANRHLYERLAKILPYSILLKCSLDQTAVQAMLLGCAGLLPRLMIMYKDCVEVRQLVDIFEFNAHKYGLETIGFNEWNLFARMGDNHPVVRLLQLASLISNHDHLLDNMLDCCSRLDVERLFCSTSLPGWASRFLSDDNPEGAITRNKAYMMGINVVAQMQILYSEYTLRSDLDSRGNELLENLPAENNSYIARWAKLGIKCANALESQALLQLSKEYCSRGNCDHCPLSRFMEGV